MMTAGGARPRVGKLMRTPREAKADGRPKPGLHMRLRAEMGKTLGVLHSFPQVNLT